MRRLFPFFLLIVAACIDPLKVDVLSVDRRLVVDGLITDKPGPYQVKLFYSNRLSTTNLNPYEPVINAAVFIVDDFNNSFALSEIEPGTYQTSPNELKGEVGRSYYVKIQTPDGGEYQSSPQELVSAGEIKSVYFQFEKDGLPGNQSGTFIDALKVFIDAKGEKGKQNLFRWRWTTVFKAKSYPELKTKSTPGGEIPTPEPCSGFIYQNRRLIQVGECTCCICWSYNYSSGVKVSQNDFVTDNEFNNQDLGKIPVTSMNFYDRYYIEAEQLSLSDEAYDFWSLVEKQQAGSTDLFQPNAIKIKGNISCLSNPEEEVLGFFGVSGSSTRSMFIDEAEIPYEIPDIDSVRYSCKSYFFNSTTDKPLFW